MEVHHLPALGRESPYAGLFNDMITQGSKSGASDIHIQPERDGVEIRFRIYGEMIRWKWIPLVHKSSFLQEAKQLSHCSLAISGRPQDARFSNKDLKLDIRVNLIPSLQGEKMVLRLLDQTREFQLDFMGLPVEGTQAIRRALDHRTGVILMTGPTGSGKTTLLYSALAALDRSQLNLVTIEDPVEYTFPGITQIQVTSKLTFAEALRSILRQDPDVILVGEVRDTSTAELCFQAAATGHLVLSTLHSNSAEEVSHRLQGLGIQPDWITSCLRFSSAQRLIGKLCDSCRLPVSEEDLQRGLGCIVNVELIKKKNPNGCDQCSKGLKGRIPVFEFMEWDRKDNSYLGADLDSNPLNPTLQDGALMLAQKGEVDVFEALRVE